jgi:hypothetical protein
MAQNAGGHKAAGSGLFVDGLFVDGLFVDAGVTQVPEPLMGGDQAFHVAPARAVGREWAARQHHLEHMQKLFRYLEVRLVAGVVKSDENLVGQAPAVSRRSRRTGFPANIVIAANHRYA